MRVRSKKQFALFVCVGILLAAVAVAALLHTPPAKRYLLTQASKYLRARAGIAFEAGRFDYSLFSLQIELGQCTFRSAADSRLPPFLTIQHFAFRLSLAAVLRGTMPVRDARLSGVAVNIVVSADGQSNLPKPAAGEAKAPATMRIPALSVTDSSFQYNDLQHDLAVSLPLWNLIAEESAANEERANIRFESLQGSVALSRQQVVLSRILLEGELDGTHARIRSLAIEADMARASARGEIALSDARLNLEVDAVARMDRLDSFLGLSGNIEGELAVHALATGVPPDMEIRGEVSGEKLSAFGYRGLGVAANPNWSGSSGGLDVGAFELRSGGGSIQGSARWAPAGAAPSRFRARLANWDVRPASEVLKLPVQIASRATGVMEAEWSGNEVADARGEAAFRLTPDAAGVRGNLAPLTASLQLNHAAGRTELKVLSASVPGLRFRGEVSSSNFEALAGEADLHVPDLGALSENLHAVLGSNFPQIAVPIGGNMDLSARIGGTLKQPAFQLEMEGRQIRIDAISDIVLWASLSADPARILLQESRITWAGATLSVGGSLEIAQSPPALALSARVENASIADISAALMSEVPMTGAIEARAEVTGPLSNPEAEAELRIRRLQAYGEPLGDLQAGITFSGRRLDLKRLSLERKEASADAREIFAARGHYDLGTSSFEAHAEALSADLHALNLPGDLPVRGALSLAASGSGTFSNPTVNAAFDFRDLRVGESAVGRFRGNARLLGNELEIALQAPDLNLSASGALDLQPPYAARLEASAEGMPLDRLNLAVAPGTPLQGAISGRLSAAGRIEEWRKAEGDIQIQRLQIAVRDRTIANDGALRFSLADGALTIGQLALMERGSRIRIQGMVPLFDPGQAADLKIAGEADLATVMDFLPQGAGISVAGTAEADVRIEGSRNALRVSGSARLRGGSFEIPTLPVPLTQLDADMRVRDGILLLDRAQGKLADGAIRTTGSLPLGLIAGNLPVRFEAPGGAAHLTLDLSDLSIAALPRVPAGLTGAIALHVDAEATRPEFDAVRAEVRLEKLDLAFDEYRLGQPRPSTIAIDGGVARIRQFAVSGTGTDLQASGHAELTGEKALALQVRGRMDAALLTFLSKDLRAGGGIEVQVDVGNTLGYPRLSGSLESQDARLSLRYPRLLAEDLNFRIHLDQGLVSIDRLAGNLNGGSLKAGGGFRLSGAGIIDVDIQAGARDVALDFPAGLKSALDADLTIRSRDDLIVVGGTAHILEGSYRAPLDLEGEVLRYLRSDQSLNLSAEPDPFLSKIRYRVRLDTQSPVLVDNNLARLALDAGLEVSGTYYRPVVTGRITLEEGGEVFLSERKYVIERGIIDLQNPLRIEPALDLLAKTKVGPYDIDLQIRGTPENLTSSLTSPSHPDLTEPDIVSLLLTGRTLENAQGAQLNVAKEQALSYLVGRVGSTLSRQAEQTLGLNQVRVEPNLISPESDPGARLTVGKNIAPNFQLIYSMNLANSSDQIWIADYKPLARFDTRAMRQSDSSYRFDFRHDLRLGSTGAAARSALPRAELKIGRIEFRGDLFHPESELKRKVPFDAGDRYDFFKLRKGMDALEKLYGASDRLEAQIRLERQEQAHTVNLTFNIHPGPKVAFVFEGMSPSGDLEKRVRQAWEDGVFDQQRAAEAVRLIRDTLVKDGHVEAEVRYDVRESPGGGEKNIIFRIDPGARYTSVKLIFDGASAVPPSELKKSLVSAGQELDIYLAPERVSDLLKRLYRSQGYLDARIDPPRTDLHPDTGSGTVTIHIEEGPRFDFGRASFKGNAAYPSAELDRVMAPFSGRPYRPESLSDAMAKLQDFYARHGFNNVAINYAIEKRPGAPVLDVGFEITENKQEIIGRITVHGDKRASADFVRSRLTFSTGESLDYTKLNQSRKRLYDTGAYAMVYLQTVEAKEAAAAAAGATRPVEVQVNLREIKPYRLNYGGFFDTDRGPGGIVEFTRQNIWGAARQLGFQGRYDGDIHEIRGFFGQPFLMNFPLKTSATVFLRREVNPTFLNDRTGFSLQQEAQLGSHLIFSYGYRYEKTHTFDKNPDPLFPFDITLPVAYLSSALTRDRRDDLLDATRGSFTSHNFEYAPKILGSEIRLIRYFGQYFHYVPLSRPVEAPMSGGAKKSRLVYAVAVRLGVAKGLGGQIVAPSERFFAGGGTTVRGFDQNGLGPVDFEGSPVGGDAMFVLNNEIRFPIASIFDGAGFLDLGNVYRTISDFDPFRVRKSAGIGLRVRTPFLLLRLDYGFKLDRQPGERLGKLYFSIGQAF